MGGRGMGSATSRKGASKGPRSVSDSIAKLKGIGLNMRADYENELQGLGDRFAHDMADQLEKLEGKYGAIAENSDGGGMNMSIGKRMGGTFAYVSRYRGTTRIIDFRISADRDYKSLNDKVKSSHDSNWMSKTKLSGIQQIATHEYGHILQFTMAKKAGKTDERGIGAFASGQKKSIMNIAKKKYGATADDVSRYALTNSKEFFAEAFTSAVGGSPNAIGKAFNDYMDKYLR